jgi:hypothetical protein
MTEWTQRNRVVEISKLIECNQPLTYELWELKQQCKLEKCMAAKHVKMSLHGEPFFISRDKYRLDLLRNANTSEHP